jgi:hypothetical protein
MALDTSSQVNLNVLRDVYFHYFQCYIIRCAAYAQINASKGVLAIRACDDSPAGRQVWNVGQDKRLSLCRTSSGPTKIRRRKLGF